MSALAVGACGGASATTTATVNVAPSSSPTPVPFAVSLTVVGAVSAGDQERIAPSCRTTVGPSNRSDLSLALSPGVTGAPFTVVVPGYHGAGTYDATTVVSTPGGTAVRYVLPGAALHQTYDASSGSIVVIGVAGAIVTGSVKVSLVDTTNRALTATMTGSFTCHLG